MRGELVERLGSIEELGHDAEAVGIAEGVEQVAGRGQLVVRPRDERADRIQRGPWLEREPVPLT